MSCDHNCSGCQSKCDKESQLFKTNEKNKIKKIIGVVSGKGGVGKSLVTTLTAVELAKQGYKVGILDSDITGPSIPKAFGLPAGIDGDDNLMYPAITKKYGIKTISINLLIEDPTQAVVWRGPVLNSAIKQFYADVLWGELDVLLIDMPPGTGDVALTVFQSIPVDGVIIVSTPQDLVKMIVGKAVSMCNQMNVNIIGLVENMSYIKCPTCSEIIFPFGDSKLNDVADFYNLFPIQSLPLVTANAKAIDNGDAEEIDTDFIKPTVEAIKEFNN